MEKTYINISEKYGDMNTGTIGDFRAVNPDADLIEKDGAIYERVWDSDNSSYDEEIIALEN